MKRARRKAKKLPYKEIDLPEKASDLIELALRDLENVEALPQFYTINMNTCHEPNGKCTVCFAGAVLAQTFNVPRDRFGWLSGVDKAGKNRKGGGMTDDTDSHETKWSEYNQDRLDALDDFRKGQVYSGLAEMFEGRSMPASVPRTIDVPNYGRSRGSRIDFKRTMRDLAGLLRLNDL